VSWAGPDDVVVTVACGLGGPNNLEEEVEPVFSSVPLLSLQKRRRNMESGKVLHPTDTKQSRLLYKKAIITINRIINLVFLKVNIICLAITINQNFSNGLKKPR